MATQVNEFEAFIEQLKNMVKESHRFRSVAGKYAPFLDLLDKFKPLFFGIGELIEESEKRLNDDAQDLAYGNIADFIANRHQLPADEAYIVAVGLVREPRAMEFLQRRRIVARNPSEVHLAELSRAVLSIKQRYRRGDSDSAEAITEILHLKDGRPQRTTISNKQSWDALPSDVQGHFIRTSETDVEFTLFPVKE